MKYVDNNVSYWSKFTKLANNVFPIASIKSYTRNPGIDEQQVYMIVCAPDAYQKDVVCVIVLPWTLNSTHVNFDT